MYQEASRVSDDTETWIQQVARVGVPLGLAAVTGVFVAIGIEGDLLTRVVRNNPNLVIAAFILSVVAILIGMIPLSGRPTGQGRGAKKVRVVLSVLAAICLVLAVFFALSAGTSGLGSREQPTILLDA